ncbi:MAG TPA: hypothetical protein VIT91_19070 [Chthoniobacterales bacterium]
MGLVSATSLAASPTRFQTLYDYYFPKSSNYVTSGYRKWFDQTVFNSEARHDLARNERMLYGAMRGDSAAFHAFLHSSYRRAGGEFGETWNYECVLLLLVLDDERFASLLAQEDQNTRALVGAALNSQIDWRKHPFPKTRKIYLSARPK